ncbi:hypothetical protein RJ55_05168 [Drechmeria coniospora]|nr:hypothetical protein RJ55_05168 [Drechmeria coniospora]
MTLHCSRRLSPRPWLGHVMDTTGQSLPPVIASQGRKKGRGRESGMTTAQYQHVAPRCNARQLKATRPVRPCRGVSLLSVLASQKQRLTGVGETMPTLWPAVTR